MVRLPWPRWRLCHTTEILPTWRNVAWGVLFLWSFSRCSFSPWVLVNNTVASIKHKSWFIAWLFLVSLFLTFMVEMQRISKNKKIRDMLQTSLVGALHRLAMRNTHIHTFLYCQSCRRKQNSANLRQFNQGTIYKRREPFLGTTKEYRGRLETAWARKDHGES